MKAPEAALNSLDAAAAPDELLPIIAHELNSSLQALLAQLQLLQRDLAHDPALQHRLEQVQRNAHRHSETISSLAAYSQRIPKKQLCRAEDCGVVAFTSARGKVNFILSAKKCFSNCFSGIGYNILCLHTKFI